MSPNRVYLAFGEIFMRSGPGCPIETVTNELISVRSEDLSSVDLEIASYWPVNFADFTTPVPLSILGTKYCNPKMPLCHVDPHADAYLAEFSNLLDDRVYNPRLKLPQAVTQVREHWKNCDLRPYHSENKPRSIKSMNTNLWS
jgi:hypothetical protein